MSKFDIIREAFLGNLPEQIPISLWRHHPEQDRTPEGLATAEIAFHQKFNHDLLKISFHGRYPVVDWGCKVYYDGSVSGATTCKECRVKDASDWEALEPLDVNSGEFGEQVRAVELIAEYAQDIVPTMATIFDATMVASKLCAGRLTEYFSTHPEIIDSALSLINDVMIDFALATLDAGANGLFIASQHSTDSIVTDAQYARFVLPYNLKMLSKLGKKAEFIVFHLHAHKRGERVRIENFAHVPWVKGINWEDQSAIPSLKEGKQVSGKTVLGGLDHQGLLRSATPDKLREQIVHTMKDAGIRRLIIAPGCVITIDTPSENIQAAIDTVRSVDPWSEEWEAFV